MKEDFFFFFFLCDCCGINLKNVRFFLLAVFCNLDSRHDQEDMSRCKLL